MNFNKIDELKQNDFKGFFSIQDLWNNKTVIPRIKGVYLVINPNYKDTEFISPGVGGFFKGKNPNISVSELKKNHILNSRVIYIGKAGSLTGKASLYSRIGQYLRFGQGKNVGHWGGRLIWQLKNHKDLIFCWRTTPKSEPREVEKELLQVFINQFGRIPFANLSR